MKDERARRGYNLHGWAVDGAAFAVISDPTRPISTASRDRTRLAQSDRR